MYAHGDPDRASPPSVFFLNGPLNKQSYENNKTNETDNKHNSICVCIYIFTYIYIYIYIVLPPIQLIRIVQGGCPVLLPIQKPK